ncbi:putative zinc finger CCHC domain-containing protein 3-like [Apostichopus japonicus]|uniref:Putative zinc finger CCHC domain-containing protein 3-like n=1 Tax=Stichopus japonicus TaxID=307972 RepID=A0A2G8KBQ2_STIJA|nr:putative zinc finger CCHC domain-containing protein 3-like [Apostichopus japonicus]
MTVTPYERSVWVTIIHVGLEVRQELVVTVLGRFGAVKAAKMCSYAQAPGVLNGHRQVRIDLKQDIPSFLFIAGHKAHVRYPRQPRTCFRCGETGHEAKGCPNKKCGRCLRLGHDSTACPNEVVCSLCGKEGHVFRACPSSYVSRTKVGPQPRARTEKVSTSFPHQLVQFRPQSAAGIARSGALSDGESVVIDSPEALSDSDSGESVISEPKRATGTSWYDEMGEPSLKKVGFK